MSLSPKMLPCKKRRGIPVDSPEGETGPSSGAPSVTMETSSSGGIHQFQGLVQQDEEAVLTEKRARLSPPVERFACSSPPTLPAPVGDFVSKAPGSEIAKGVDVPSRNAPQKGYREPAEALLKGEKKVFSRPGSDGCRQKSEASQDSKAAPDFVMEKEQKLGREAVGLSPKPGAECEEGDAASNTKAPKFTQGSELLLEAEEEAEEMGLFIPVEEQEEGGKKKRRRAAKRKREGKGQEEEEEEEAPLACDLRLDDTLDRTLEDGAKQHNLTAVNVRNILHEVITNEHVVAMMKAAISETEDIPMFEPKMTRSKLKEVVEKGVVIPTWNISPIKKANEIKPPQFVDIPLEEDDSSDEEYQPEEEEEDETAEEGLLESDVESATSSPHGPKYSHARQSSDAMEVEEEGVVPLEAEKASVPPLQRHISAEVVPMGPPPPPKPKQSKDCTFMEKLHAVDEELASSPVCMDSYQPLEDSLIAFRTRSKRPLKDVPLGQLEAELRAPDITPDMYDPNTADDEEWKSWLGGLMNDDVGNEDEADDDDDPEYNFLEDLDEPDTEDFRNDRAVRITKKEVNELMEELFETFQDEMGFSNVEDEGPEDEDSAAEARPTFNTPQVLRFEEPLANLLKQHRTVKEQLEQLRMKKSVIKPPLEVETPKPPCKKPPVLTLDARQRKKLQHQMQQHVQLLTQIHLLCSSTPSLSSEASTTELFLTELNSFAQSAALLHHPLNPKAQTSFQPCNLKEALQLVEDFHAHVKVEGSPRKGVKKNAQDVQCLPKQVAWILATRQVFMYPQLLPICALKAKTPRDKIIFTKGEDNLLALGLKHFEGTEFPKPLISKYLLTTKTAHQLMVHIKNFTMNRAPDNVIKYYKKTKQLPVLSPLCEEIQPGDRKPPIEREEHLLPSWLKDSLPYLQEALEQRAEEASPDDSKLGQPVKESAEWMRDGKYSLHAPNGLELILRPLPSHFYKKSWRRQRPATAKALPARSGGAGNCPKVTPKQSQPEAPPSKMAARIPRWIQPAPVAQPLPRVQHVSLQPAVANGSRFELRGLLPAQHSGARPCLAAAVPQNLISSVPVAFQPKMMLPVLPVSKIWKPSSPRRYQKKRGPKSAPLLPSAPVVFTVPAAAVKTVSIANGCNVLQPLASVAGGPTQPIPITTLLVNPAPFSCPLSQPLVTSPSPSLVVPANSPSFPASAKGTEFVSLAAGGGECGCPVPEPQMEPREPSLRATTPAEEDRGPQTSEPEVGGQTAASIQGCMEATKEKVAELPAEGHLSPLAELAEKMEAESEEFCSVPPEAAPVPAETSSVVAPVEEELVLGLGQELDVDPTPEGASEPKETKDERSAAEMGGQRPGGTAAGAEGGSPKDVSNTAAGEAESRSPSVKPEDPPSADGPAAGVVAGREATGEKDGPEEEEEEDFDDLTQDEEDEMSSASEESVLSVPELQETMEKLTWLASERRLSQEGDSEEENSQEENSEPEEEEEEEEEGEGENPESLQKEDEMMDEAAGPGDGPASSLALTSAAPEVEPSSNPPGECAKAPGKSRGSHRARAKRGRARASKDTSKLLLLYDEDILERDPLREQKDLAFAQAYLSRVREALRHLPGKYEEFLRIIYEFESNAHKQTAVDLYARLRSLLREWPQLLTDFAAFLLPEQALECGLFEEQQAFEKSRKFLRQLEICFAENPSHHQKIIKVLQSCAECLPQEIMELKTQMWQLLKGHDHLQDEFSIFFDHLRPSASRMGDFEEVSWTEEKEYEFDGFEEVLLPDAEEDEEPPKIHASSKHKKRKELGGQNADKEAEWAEGAKECSCTCHEGNGDARLKRSKRKGCSHCSNKAGDGKVYKPKEAPEPTDGLVPPEPNPRPEGKELAEENPEHKDDREAPQGRVRAAARRADFAVAAGSRTDGKVPSCREASLEGDVALAGRTVEPRSLQGPHCPQKAPAADAAAQPPATPASSLIQAQRTGAPKQRPKGGGCPAGGEGEAGRGPRSTEASCGLGKDLLGPEASVGTAGKVPGSPPAKSLPQRPALQPALSEEPATLRLQETEGERLAASAGVKAKEAEGVPPKDPGPKAAAGKNSGSPACAESPGPCHLRAPASDQKAKAAGASGPSARLQEQPPAVGGAEQALPRPPRPRGEEPQQRATEAVVCAKNIKVSSTGEKVVLWTREADRVILTTCQERGAQQDTFQAISRQLHNKTAEEVAQRFRELMTLFHTACDVSSDDEDDGTSTSNTDQLSDKDPVLSEEEQEE
ncbi:PREDICTED: GON-4-like protein [Gekko japonicus]|uniref:GON-4-like protein n=1 Tax=Gekko japonicus TaxID=146911 RepID=A0ABM1KVC4_GEKJA|nr:PREDICTED: GON-4-like protein [Gekko japonicus]